MQAAGLSTTNKECPLWLQAAGCNNQLRAGAVDSEREHPNCSNQTVACDFGARVKPIRRGPPWLQAAGFAKQTRRATSGCKPRAATIDSKRCGQRKRASQWTSGSKWLHATLAATAGLTFGVSCTPNPEPKRLATWARSNLATSSQTHRRVNPHLLVTGPGGSTESGTSSPESGSSSITGPGVSTGPSGCKPRSPKFTHCQPSSHTLSKSNQMTRPWFAYQGLALLKPSPGQ